jgi:hypothetical protein
MRDLWLERENELKIPSWVNNKFLNGARTMRHLKYISYLSDDELQILIDKGKEGYKPIAFEYLSRDAQDVVMTPAKGACWTHDSEFVIYEGNILCFKDTSFSSIKKQSRIKGMINYVSFKVRYAWLEIKDRVIYLFTGKTGRYNCDCDDY